MLHVVSCYEPTIVYTYALGAVATILILTVNSSLKRVVGAAGLQLSSNNSNFQVDLDHGALFAVFVA